MNWAEKNEVIDFLKKKKLSAPLYQEVLEHFLTDIERAVDEGAGFQEAFLKAKIKWQPELQMVSPDPLSFKKIPKIEADLMGTRFSAIIRIASTAAIGAMLLTFIYQPAALYFAFALSVLLVLAVLFLLFSGKLSFTEYIRMSFHPLIIKFTVLYILLFVLFRSFSDQIFADHAVTVEAVTITFTAVLQLQLLALHRKKINVLLS